MTGPAGSSTFLVSTTRALQAQKLGVKPMGELHGMTCPLRTIGNCAGGWHVGAAGLWPVQGPDCGEAGSPGKTCDRNGPGLAC